MIASILWDIDPNLFAQIEFLRWYGVSWAVGIILAFRLVRFIYLVEGADLAQLERLTNYLFLGILIGARLGHILFYDPIYYFHHPIEVLPIRLEPRFEFTGLSGLASHGGILGAFFALYLFQRKSNINVLWTLDRLVIGGALLGGFIRLGNLMNSEIIGTPTNLPWGFTFIRVDAIPRHPAQLYEALVYFLIAYLLYHLWSNTQVQSRNGFLFGLCIALIFTMRFLIEFVKENQVHFEEDLTFNMGQILSVPLVLGGIACMVWSIKRPASPTI